MRYRQSSVSTHGVHITLYTKGQMKAKAAYLYVVSPEVVEAIPVVQSHNGVNADQGPQEGVEVQLWNSCLIVPGLPKFKCQAGGWVKMELVCKELGWKETHIF